MATCDAGIQPVQPSGEDRYRPICPCRQAGRALSSKRQWGPCSRTLFLVLRSAWMVVWRRTRTFVFMLSTLQEEADGDVNRRLVFGRDERELADEVSEP